MTPKEKAEELVDKYFIVIDNSHPLEDILKTAKQCAIITIDEILFSNNTIFETNIPHECWKYWIEVKQELQDEKRNN